MPQIIYLGYIFAHMEIKRIKPEETWTIRHEVMWPHMPIDFVKLDGDDEAYHFGFYMRK